MKIPLIAVASVLLLAGCSAATPSATDTPAEDTLTGTVTVFAAASLTESFGEIGDAFMAEHPDVTVVFNFGGSSGLATQIVEGAPADVFAAASGKTMETVTAEGLTTADPTPFVTNILEIAVPAGNPAGITGLADFANEDLAIAICDVEVPCGAASQAAFEAAGITAAPDTLEQDVKAVLTKVELGEADAGLVYKTDVLVAGDTVEGLEVDGAEPVTYPIAQLTGAPNPDAAAAFIAYVLSDEGNQVLLDAGFGTP